MPQLQSVPTSIAKSVPYDDESIVVHSKDDGCSSIIMSPSTSSSQTFLQRFSQKVGFTSTDQLVPKCFLSSNEDHRNGTTVVNNGTVPKVHIVNNNRNVIVNNDENETIKKELLMSSKMN